MIKLTRLNGSELYLNTDLIETIEATPDTHLTLANGQHYVVLEEIRVIVERIVAYKARIARRSNSNPTQKYLRRRQLESYLPQCRLED